MTDAPISPLRRRMIEDMTIRKFAPRTQASYLRAVRNFTVFLGRSPDQASAEDLRRYQLHLSSSGISTPSLNAAVTALRFFFTVTLGQSELTDRMPFVREPRKCGRCESERVYSFMGRSSKAVRSADTRGRSTGLHRRGKALGRPREAHPRGRGGYRALPSRSASGGTFFPIRIATKRGHAPTRKHFEIASTQIRIPEN
jgi:hypothetical protein